MAEQNAWTTDDTWTILDLITAYAGRESGKADAIAWTAAARAGNWDPGLAQEAVIQFHLASSGLITVADVNTYIRSKRQDRAMRAVVDERRAAIDPIRHKRPVEAVVRSLLQSKRMPEK